MQESFTESAAALIKIRAVTGKSRYAFARDIGMDGSALAKYEKGEHSMSFDRIAALARKAGLQISIIPKEPETPPYALLGVPEFYDK